MHWKTLKIATVVALLASPSAFAAIPQAGAFEEAVTAAEVTPPTQLAHHRGDRGDRFHHRRPRDVRHRHFDRGRFHYHRGWRHHHPRYRHHHGPRHFRGRPVRRLFRHWLRHHY